MNRRLYRSRSDSVLGGVAGGVADYLDLDPAIVRIIWAVLALLTGGLFVVLYVVMWIVVPEAPAGPVPGQAAMPPPAEGAMGDEGTAGEAAAPATAWSAYEPQVRRAGSGGAVIFGLVLIGAGIWFLIDQYVPAFDRDLIWPIALVAVGVALLLVSLRRRA